MPDLVTTFGPLTLRTFPLALGLASLAALALAWRRLRGAGCPGALVDVAIGGAVGAVVGSRLGHVLLNADYFVAHPGEIARLASGGQDWHGALLGGLLALALVARWRRVPLAPVLDALALALPLLALGAWYGCRAAACGYGVEVDTLARYPAWAVSELPDVYGIVAPRVNTQLFGMALSGAAFALAVLLRPIPARPWLVLALLAGGLFVLGFLRADPATVVAGFRLDQWLDALILGLALGAALVSRRAGILVPARQ